MLGNSRDENGQSNEAMINTWWQLQWGCWGDGDDNNDNDNDGYVERMTAVSLVSWGRGAGLNGRINKTVS